MKFALHAGTETLNHINYRNRIYADGQQLAISNGEFVYLLSAFVVTSVVIESEAHSGNVLHLQLSSQGNVTPMHNTEVEALFRNVNNLSVDDLLKELHARMEQRTEELTTLPGA